MADVEGRWDERDRDGRGDEEKARDHTVAFPGYPSLTPTFAPLSPIMFLMASLSSPPTPIPTPHTIRTRYQTVVHSSHYAISA